MKTKGILQGLLFAVLLVALTNAQSQSNCSSTGGEYPTLAQAGTNTQTCPECGHENKPDAIFCANCGAKLAAETTTPPEAAKTTMCPRCGATVPEDIKFCSECGYALAAPARKEKKVVKKEPLLRREILGTAGITTTFIGRDEVPPGIELMIGYRPDNYAIFTFGCGYESFSDGYLVTPGVECRICFLKEEDVSPVLYFEGRFHFYKVDHVEGYGGEDPLLSGLLPGIGGGVTYYTTRDFGVYVEVGYRAQIDMIDLHWEYGSEIDALETRYSNLGHLAAGIIF